MGYTALVAGLLALAWFLYQEEIKALFKAKRSTTEPENKPAPSGANTGLNANKTLKKGIKGAEVTQLQRYLKRDGGANLLGSTGSGQDGVDGDFGVKTEAALKKVKGVVQITLSQYNSGNEFTQPIRTPQNAQTPPFMPDNWRILNR